MRRWVLALAGLALLAMLAGCAGFGGSAISQEDLAKDATYDWNTTENVTVNATGQEYRAVYAIDNRSSLTLASSGQLGSTQPLPIKAVKFRYPNGTVVGADAFNVYTKNSRTVVEFPAENGKFAYMAESGPRSLYAPVALEDASHEIILPAGMRVEFPVFGSVRPGGYEKTVQDNRVHLVWESVNADTISVQYYLLRDLYLFGGLVGVLALIAVGGVLYFRLQIRRLERNREEAGLGVDRE